MKQKILLLFMALAALQPLRTAARDFTYTYEGQTVTYTVIDEAARTCATKAGTSDSPGNSLKGDLILPVNPKDGDIEFTLIQIGANSFCNTDITSIVIPETVTSIGSEAFSSSGLLSLDIPDSVVELGVSFCQRASNLKTVHIGKSVTIIPETAFRTCRALEEVSLPVTLKSIGTWAFIYCDNLKSFAIPDGVVEIGAIPFYGSGLEKIFIGASISQMFIGNLLEPIRNQITEVSVSAFNKDLSAKDGVLFDKNQSSLIFFTGSSVDTYIIPSTVKIIINYAFMEAALKSVEIPNSVETIESNAFMGAKLTSVVIPESVKQIGDYGFYNCNDLMEVTIKGKLPTLGANVFGYCPQLKLFSIEDSNFVVNDGMLYTSDFATLVTSIGVLDGKYTLPDGIKEIADRAFEGSDKITEIIIPSSVTKIGSEAFIYCWALESVEIPNSVESIGANAFGDCLSLRTINLPVGLTRIENELLQGCSSLTSVGIPESVSSIGLKAFGGCSSLTSLMLPHSLDSIGKKTFVGCEKLEKVYAPSIESWMNIKFANETANPLCYGAELIINNQSTDVVEIPEETEEVSDYAFAGLKNLVEVVISEAVEKIGNGSFTGTGLENITIPQSVKEIGEKAFQNCKSLISAVIGKITGKLTRAREVAESDLTSVGNEAFAGCESLDRVSIGSNVGSIGELAFAGSGSITRVDVYSLIAPEAADDAFDAEVYAQAELHVPAGYADIFESAPVWSSFSKIVADLDAPGTIIEVSGIELNLPEVTVKEEETVQLVATVTPADADDQTVTWSSSNETVATVDQDGLVTALKAGTATITARTANGLTAKCELTVETKTGIDGVEADAQVSVVARDGVITVTAPEGTEVEVYSMTGMRVAKTREHRIEGLAGGVYIVRVAAKSFKVML